MLSFGISTYLVAALLLGATPPAKKVGEGVSQSDTIPVVAPQVTKAKVKKNKELGKKNDKKPTKIHRSKVQANAVPLPIPEPISQEDAEIIKHLEFLLMLGLLEDFDLFEQEPKPK